MTVHENINHILNFSFLLENLHIFSHSCLSSLNPFYNNCSFSPVSYPASLSLFSFHIQISFWFLSYSCFSFFRLFLSSPIHASLSLVSYSCFSFSRLLFMLLFLSSLIHASLSLVSYSCFSFTRLLFMLLFLSSPIEALSHCSLPQPRRCTSPLVPVKRWLLELPAATRRLNHLPPTW